MNRHRFRQVFFVVVMVVMFVISAGAPGSYGHRHGQGSWTPDNMTARSVNWNGPGR